MTEELTVSELVNSSQGGDLASRIGAVVSQTIASAGSGQSKDKLLGGMDDGFSTERRLSPTDSTEAAAFRQSGGSMQAPRSKAPKQGVTSSTGTTPGSLVTPARK